MDKIEVSQRAREAVDELFDPATLGFSGLSLDAMTSFLARFERDILATRTDATPVARKQFPILGSRGAKIDLQLVEDHGKQAYSNHYQTVERLAERGGLSWCELHAVLNNRPWQKLDENTAIAECRAIEARYLGAFNPPATDVAALVEAAKACQAQFTFYATEHRNAEKHEKAATNQRFADDLSAALAPFTKGQDDE